MAVGREKFTTEGVAIRLWCAAPPNQVLGREPLLPGGEFLSGETGQYQRRLVSVSRHAIDGVGRDLARSGLADAVGELRHDAARQDFARAMRHHRDPGMAPQRIPRRQWLDAVDVEPLRCARSPIGYLNASDRRAFPVAVDRERGATVAAVFELERGRRGLSSPTHQQDRERGEQRSRSSPQPRAGFPAPFRAEVCGRTGPTGSLARRSVHACLSWG